MTNSSNKAVTVVDSATAAVGAPNKGIENAGEVLDAAGAAHVEPGNEEPPSPAGAAAARVVVVDADAVPDD